jgi:cytochrome c biogenesis protein CcmG/thiol:disulfide interchange protein DsbE
VLAFAGVLLILALIGLRLINNDATPLRLGEQPEGFSLTTFEGEVINSADLRGQVVLINFWASWCTTCDAEAALLEQAWQHYQAETADRVVFLGVAYMDTENSARAYVGNHGVTFPNGQDLRGAISRIYQVKSVPETFILDANGILSSRKIGPFSSLGEILTAVDGAVSHSGN